MTDDEINRKVAEAQGWTDGYTTNPSWKMDNNEYIAVPDYDPVNNSQQAGELLEKYEMELMRTRLETVDQSWRAGDGYSYAYADTWRKAACLAVIAMSEVK